MYKGKYLISVYLRDDELENCIGVFENMEDLAQFINVKWIKSIISRSLKTYHDYPTIESGKYKFCFTDIYEAHDDVFKEEDELFLKYHKTAEHISVKEFCVQRGINERSFYRHLKEYRESDGKHCPKEIEEFLKQNKEKEQEEWII